MSLIDRAGRGRSLRGIGQMTRQSAVWTRGEASAFLIGFLSLEDLNQEKTDGELRQSAVSKLMRCSDPL